jgi:2-keto-3-deoxy-L-rhamnonate aldolase RhmA
VRENKLSAMLAAGEPTLGTRIHSTWPGVVEALGHTRAFDYVEFLAEEAPFSLHDLEALTRAAELHDLNAIIKIEQEPRMFLAQRAIGAGFQGILFADCRSAADVRSCIATTLPDTPEHQGTLGVGMRRFAYMGYGGDPEYLQTLEQIVVGVMIEKQGAVEAIDEILGLPGLSLIQFGPFDYALNTGRFGANRREEVREIEEDIIARCLKANVPVRAEIGSPAQAEYYRSLGVRHFALGVDLMILHQWWSENGATLRQIVNSR